MIHNLINEFKQGIMVGIGSVISFGVLLYMITDFHDHQIKKLITDHNNQIRDLNNTIYTLNEKLGSIAISNASHEDNSKYTTSIMK